MWQDLKTKDKNGRYTVRLAIPKTDPDLPAFTEWIEGEVAKAHGGQIPPGFRWPIQDGDLGKNGQPPKPYTAGCTVFNFATNLDTVDLLSPDGLAQLAPEAFYSGAKARVRCDAYVYTTPNHGVRLSMYAVQFAENGERIAAERENMGEAMGSIAKAPSDAPWS